MFTLKSKAIARMSCATVHDLENLGECVAKL